MGADEAARVMISPAYPLSLKREDGSTMTYAAFVAGFTSAGVDGKVAEEAWANICKSRLWRFESRARLGEQAATVPYEEAERRERLGLPESVTRK